METIYHEVQIDNICNIQIWSTIKECYITDEEKIIDISFNNDTQLIIEYDIYGFLNKESYNIFTKFDKNILNELKTTDDFIDSVIINVNNNDNNAIVDIIGKNKDYSFKIYNMHDGFNPVEIRCKYNNCIYKFVL
jgi:hypothetical protein